jgi:uracil-DNA glycosylase
MVKINNSWDTILKDVWTTEYYKNLREYLKDEYSRFDVYPDMYSIFNALKLTDYSDVRAVIIGQDPYHQPHQAHGLAFSVQDGIPFPPSLCNIFKELNDDLGINIPQSGNLTKWAKNGVLLINNVLTVRRGQAGSHRNRGWEKVTDEIIIALNKRETPIVFILWGSDAKNKAQLVTNPIHHKLFAVHPSPLSAHRGFFGCKHFSKCNELLKKEGLEPIDWSL